MYNNVNDGNPTFQIGSAGAEMMKIQPIYDSGATTLNYVAFQTSVASGTADKGAMVFQPDDTSVLAIDDGGINFQSNKFFIFFFYLLLFILLFFLSL